MPGGFMYNFLKKTDPEIYDIVMQETEKQQNTLGMIASENYASMAVLEAMSTTLQNKYAEGYPGRRYYAGNKFVDISEQLAIDRLKKLYGAEHANVQPNAGSGANMAVYYALLKPGDKILSMSLDQGGHLTHGSPVNFSGNLYKPVFYALDKETHRIDYDEVRKVALREKPKLVLSGFTAYPREIDFKKFQEIAQEVGAYAMADIAHIAGLVAGKAHMSPVPYADVVTFTTHKTLRGPRGAAILSKEVHAKAIDKAVFPGLQGGPFEHVIAAKAVCFKEAMTIEFENYSHQIVKNSRALAESLIAHGFRLSTGGSDNHMVLVDLSSMPLTGKDGQEKLEEIGIIANRNMIPYDTRPPFVTSGLRLGTAVLTTRGFTESDMQYVGDIIHKSLLTDVSRDAIKAEVLELCKKYPVYQNIK
ncbi:serine hydroxymethyltransferase [Candidatus Micrarchaeota archaeon CG08_land_8_20_14_0_20_49_17]|nr:MAG: serine hydroxymethyltransferase [Candidatus Micrarchaeota archaeon CG08_land_8_20_14_0_20_49_17]HII53555.1 serine hydroxymethyltransferase [Candidatus Micrarchaeota archaeon]